MMLYQMPISITNNSADRATAATRAANLYLSVRLQAMWSELRSRLTGSSRQLLSLAAVLDGRRIQGERYVGIHEVPLSQIRGSEGRSVDFDAGFLPRQDHTRGRWMSVAVAYELEMALPPVELIQVGESYFVRDGHHRISVAKARGQTEIEARVIRIEVAEVAGSIKPAPLGSALAQAA
ncbi:MAG TPA: hypothetical protein VER55_12440 [Ardenticatenaceae bacterium]|nr:hypothetical protein [Ardenticatenaceae bacterium]